MSEELYRRVRTPLGTMIRLEREFVRAEDAERLSALGCALLDALNGGKLDIEQYELCPELDAAFLAIDRHAMREVENE